MTADLIQRLRDEADLCRAETADDIARLLDEAADTIAAQPVMTNGLTEAETNETASVKGLAQGAAEGYALREMEARKDAAYEERNRCVALIARMAVSMGLPVAVTKTAIEGWSEDWHGCIYIGLPTGQASWHFHDSQAALFAGLPTGDATWDGHDTPEKYRRVETAFANVQPNSMDELGPAIGWLAADGRLHKGCPPISEPHGWKAVFAPSQSPAPAPEASAQELVDNMCRLGVWWTHNRAKFTTPRQAAFAAWNEAFRTAIQAPAVTHGSDMLLAEYNRPANMKNAARAGYMAARRLLQNARQPLPAVEDAEPIGWGGVIETCAELCDPHFIAQQDLDELKRYAGNWNSTYRFFPIYAPGAQLTEGPAVLAERDALKAAIVELNAAEFAYARYIRSDGLEKHRQNRERRIAAWQAARKLVGADGSNVPVQPMGDSNG